MSLSNLIPGFKGLSCALKHKDKSTHTHSNRVVQLALELGKACSLNSDDLTALSMAACLHDIGKIGIPDTVLSKKSRFNAYDWKLMHKHPEKGEEIILSLGLEHCNEIACSVRQHHENFDGTGYPDGLAGESIHYHARIVSIVDSYDAMTYSRPYQSGRSHADTMSVLYAEEGIKSDPYLFRKFTGLIERSDLKV